MINYFKRIRRFVLTCLILIVFFAWLPIQTTHAEEVILDVPMFNQLNYSSPTCIHDEGCSVTSVAMDLKYYGLNATPVNTYNANNYSCVMSWGSLDLTKIQSNPPSLVFIDMNQSHDLNSIKAKIRSGYPVIIGNDNYPGLNKPHWLIVKGFIDNSLIVNDPNGGVERTISADLVQHAKTYIGSVPQQPDPVLIRLQQSYFETFNSQLYQAARGNDGGLYIRSSSNGKVWGAWTQIGSIQGNPALKTFTDQNNVTRLFVTARGNDNKIYVESSTDGLTWSGWTSVGTTREDISLETMVVNGVDKLFLGAVGLDKSIYIKNSQNGLVWSDWSQIGTTQNAITLKKTKISGQDRLYAAAIGQNDNGLYINYTIDGDNWQNWTQLGVTTEKISLESYKLNNVDSLFVAAKGLDGTLAITYTSDGTSWDSWKVIGAIPGQAQLLNAQVDSASARLYVIARGNDNHIYTSYTTNGTWQSWYNDGLTANNPSITNFVNGNSYMLVRGAKGMDNINSLSYSENLGSWSTFSP